LDAILSNLGLKEPNLGNSTFSKHKYQSFKKS